MYDDCMDEQEWFDLPEWAVDENGESDRVDELREAMMDDFDQYEADCYGL